MFIVELEENLWIAPWDSDPGRTLVKSNAKIFRSKKSAKTAITKARTYRPFPNARIVEL